MDLRESIKRILRESLDIDYSEGTLKIIEKMMTKMDLPFVESFKVVWSEMNGAYEIKLYYPKHVKQDIRWENEMKITSTIRPFLDLPFYSVIVRSFYSEKPNEFVGGINENYTPWVKRRLKMVRNAERQASSYMTRKFKQNPQQYRKNEFIGIFFSVMTDELHGDLSNWGTEDFDYENVQQQLKDSFGEYVEELWKQLNK
jgi:hypothetical protein